MQSKQQQQTLQTQMRRLKRRSRDAAALGGVLLQSQAQAHLQQQQQLARMWS
jgi:hypothetical protein